MSIRWFKNIPVILAVLGLLLGACVAVPACFAGGAVTIVPDKNQLAPKGSYIPDRRVKEVLKKIEANKAMMEEKKALQRKEQQQDNKLPMP
jgi:hypothetical protein